MGTEVTYDESPRPRVLLVGTEDVSLIDGLVPTYAVVDGGATLMNRIRPESWDAIISVGRAGRCAPFHRVLQFGGRPHDRVEAAAMYRVTRRNVVGTEVILTEEAPDAFRDELKASVIPFVRGLALPREAIDPPGALAVDSFVPLVTDADGNAYAAIYQPIQAAREVIYLPDDLAPSRQWVTLALERWAEEDPEAFPVVADWTHRPEWMTSGELAAFATVQRTAQELAIETERLEQALRDARLALDEQRLQSENGQRLLLTGTGDDLVDCVADVLRQLGFDVEDRDETGARHKLEDLRVRDGRWTAIGEVKGYSAGGSTKDLLSLGRFSRAYEREVGSPPDAQWYIVNQFRKQDPDLRKLLLRGQDEDVDEFAKDGGLVIDTRALFRISSDHSTGRIDDTAAREMLKSARGRLEYPLVEQS